MDAPITMLTTRMDTLENRFNALEDQLNTKITDIVTRVALLERTNALRHNSCSGTECWPFLPVTFPGTMEYPKEPIRSIEQVSGMGREEVAELWRRYYPEASEEKELKVMKREIVRAIGGLLYSNTFE